MFLNCKGPHEVNIYQELLAIYNGNPQPSKNTQHKNRDFISKMS